VNLGLEGPAASECQSADTGTCNQPPPSTLSHAGPNSSPPPLLAPRLREAAQPDRTRLDAWSARRLATGAACPGTSSHLPGCTEGEEEDAAAAGTESGRPGIDWPGRHGGL